MYHLKVKTSDSAWQWVGSRWWTFDSLEQAVNHGVYLTTGWPVRITAWAVWQDACLPGGIQVAHS